MLDVTAQVTQIAERLHEMRAAGKPRIMLAIAGAPGSGKSTLATELARRLRLQKCPAEVVPLDGFRLDTTVLQARGRAGGQRGGHRGAPEDFDASGFVHLVWRLSQGREDVAAPLFDRPRDIAIAGALLVEAECPVVICEGAYLMLDDPPWSGLEGLWDLTVRIEVPLPELRARLIQRWLSHGLSRAAATRRAEADDMPNAARVIADSRAADIRLGPAPEAAPRG